MAYSYNARTKSHYEEIDPIPQRGRKKCLNQLIFVALSLCVAAIVTVVLVKVTVLDNRDPAYPDGPDFNDTIVGDNNATLKVSGNRLGAPAPAPEDAPELDVITTEQTPPEDVLVEIDQGLVKGKRMKSRAGREYLAFLGIPYAKSPVGELRFQPPVEADGWNGTLDATEFKPNCLQEDKYNPIIVTKGSEDCLYVNIYTPKTLQNLKSRRDSNRFPVMVYIHGGGQFGSATRYSAEYFMDEDVIFVTFHYRLGVLGNLNTNDTEARGNQGLKDQVMVLEWVKANIKKFGGNNRKVTIFGNSYGGMDVTMHLVSPMSEGLFHRAISQSGTELGPGIFTKSPLAQANKLGQKLNCTGNTTRELVNCLQNTPGEELILTSYLMNFNPSVEPPAPSGADDIFLPDTTLNLLQDGRISRVPAIYGVSSGEGLSTSLLVLASPNMTKALNDNWEYMAGSLLQLKNSPTLKDPERIVNAARDFYLGENNISREVEANLTALFGDRMFFHPANVFATFQLEKNEGRRRNKDNVYLYYFNKDADKSYADPALERYNGTEEFLGAGHADELQFLFPYDPYPAIPLNSEHANFSRMLVHLWATFADTGIPTGTSSEWLPIEQQKPYKWFEISEEPKMIDFLGDRMEFWDSFNLTDLYY